MADPADFSTERALAFGSFRLLPSRRLLFDGETPVRLGSRALEILIALIERRGELAGKDELINRVWPSTHIGRQLSCRAHDANHYPRTNGVQNSPCRPEDRGARKRGIT